MDFRPFLRLMIVGGAPCLRAADDDLDGELWRFPVSSAWLAQRRLVVWRLECENAAPAITSCHRGTAGCRDSAETWRPGFAWRRGRAW